MPEGMCIEIAGMLANLQRCIGYPLSSSSLLVLVLIFLHK